jgi:hypothetical protein
MIWWSRIDLISTPYNYLSISPSSAAMVADLLSYALASTAASSSLEGSTMSIPTAQDGLGALEWTNGQTDAISSLQQNETAYGPSGSASNIAPTVPFLSEQRRVELSDRPLLPGCEGILSKSHRFTRSISFDYPNGLRPRSDVCFSIGIKLHPPSERWKWLQLPPGSNIEEPRRTSTV